MHFSTLVLAALPAVVRGLTVFSDFNCGGANTTNVVIDCALVGCAPFSGFHSFKNNEGLLPLFIKTYENKDCTSPRAPVNFEAQPGSCVPAITGRPIESYRCSPIPF